MSLNIDNRQRYRNQLSTKVESFFTPNQKGGDLWSHETPHSDELHRLKASRPYGTAVTVILQKLLLASIKFPIATHFTGDYLKPLDKGKWKIFQRVCRYCWVILPNYVVL